MTRPPTLILRKRVLPCSSWLASGSASGVSRAGLTLSGLLSSPFWPRPTRSRFPLFFYFIGYGYNKRTDRKWYWSRAFCLFLSSFLSVTAQRNTKGRRFANRGQWRWSIPKHKWSSDQLAKDLAAPLVQVQQENGHLGGSCWRGRNGQACFLQVQHLTFLTAATTI